MLVTGLKLYRLRVQYKSHTSESHYNTSSTDILQYRYFTQRIHFSQEELNINQQNRVVIFKVNE